MRGRLTSKHTALTAWCIWANFWQLDVFVAYPANVPHVHITSLLLLQTSAVAQLR